MAIINQVVSGGGDSTIYGLNTKAWVGDLYTNQNGDVVMRTDQAVGTISGLSTLQIVSWSRKFEGSTGLVGATDLSSVEKGDLSYAFSNTRITSLDLRRLYDGTKIHSLCSDNPSLTSANLSDLLYIRQEGTDKGAYGAFKNCTSLRELRLPALRLDSWIWLEAEDEETGEPYYDYTDEGFVGLRRIIDGCSNCVVHCSSSLGEDLATLNGSDKRTYFFQCLCGENQATIASCSIVFDLPSNDPFYGTVNGSNCAFNRRPSADTETNLAWWCWYGSGKTVFYTSGLTAPQVGDTIYSDSSCTTAVGTVSDLSPVYEYVEPEPEEGGEDEGGEDEGDGGEE